MLHRISRSVAPVVFALLVGCSAHDSDDPATTSDEGLSVLKDDLNGLWSTSRAGVASDEDAVIESWTAVGIRLDLDGKHYDLERHGSRLTSSSPSVSLTLHANGPDVADDVIDGTVDGETVQLTRDTSPKPPITLTLPGGRPFRSWLLDELAPAAQRDRESYVVMHSGDLDAFLHECDPFKRHYWQFKYLAGAGLTEENQSFESIVAAVDGVSTSPRQMIHDPKFSAAVQANVRASWLASYAVSEFGLYFSAAAGRSVHIPIADDATIYFITDRPSREEKLGLVVTQTPLHGLLAAPFGRQLADMGSMPSTDDAIYTRAMMDLLTSSDASRAASLSSTGRSALTDWFGIMAIEDYRGVAFGHADLGWGYNFTNAQFYGLVVRALARPGATDAKGSPVTGQVIVGNELRPGDPSYADVLNDGKDMQEYQDMATLKQLATYYLLDKHPDAIAAVVQAFAGVVPSAELDDRAKYDVFHFVCAQLYDAKGRTANLTPSAAQTAGAAVGEIVDLLRRESAQLEAYILANGFSKSSVPAPKASGS